MQNDTEKLLVVHLIDHTNETDENIGEALQLLEFETRNIAEHQYFTYARKIKRRAKPQNIKPQPKFAARATKDSLHQVIETVGDDLRQAETQPKRVVIITYTGGIDNSSVESWPIRERIEDQEYSYRWVFALWGNQTEHTGWELGLKPHRCLETGHPTSRVDTVTRFLQDLHTYDEDAGFIKPF